MVLSDMCWKGRNIRKIAEKDIICYKIVVNGVFEKRSWKHLFLKRKLLKCTSLCLGYEYTTNRLNSHISIPDIPKDQEYREIERGYHSFTGSFWYRALYDELIVKCIIPKGTVYYESSETHTYVSENIIITDKIQ